MNIYHCFVFMATNESLRSFQTPRTKRQVNALTIDVVPTLPASAWFSAYKRRYDPSIYFSVE